MRTLAPYAAPPAGIGMVIVAVVDLFNEESMKRS
jgi:hypothetical protein